ncbi:MAG: hypothetical protein WCF65_09810, partial [Parachlamydiaceae bacterium]
LLEKMAESDPDAVIKLLSIPDKGGFAPLDGDATVLLPILEKMAESDPDAVQVILSMQDRLGRTLLYYHLPKLLPLLTELAKIHPNAVKELLSIRDIYGSTIFHYKHDRFTLNPLLEKMAESHPDAVIELLSIQNKKGLTPLYDDETVLLPILEILAESRPDAFFKGLLSMQDRLGRTLLYYHLPKLLPLLKKMAESHPDAVKTLLSIKDKDGNTLLHNPFAYRAAKSLIAQVGLDLSELVNTRGFSPVDLATQIAKKWGTDSKVSGIRLAQMAQITDETTFKAKAEQLKARVKTLWASLSLRFGEGEGEIKPVYLEVDGRIRTIEEIGLALVNGEDGILDKIEHQTPWLGTPPEGDTPGLLQFYSEMLLNFESIMNLLEEKNNVLESAGTLIHLAGVKIEGRCAAAYQAEIRQRELCLSGTGSLDDIIKGAASSALLAVIEKCMIKHGHQGNVHVLTTFMYAMGLVLTPDQLSPFNVEQAQKMIFDDFDMGLFLTKFKELVEDVASQYLKENTPPDTDERLPLADGTTISYSEQEAVLKEKENIEVDQAKGCLMSLLQNENIDDLFGALDELHGTSLKGIVEEYQHLPNVGIEAAVFAYGKNLVKNRHKLDDIDLTRLIGDKTTSSSKAEFDARLTTECVAKFPLEGLSPAEQWRVPIARMSFKRTIETVRGMVLSARAFEKEMDSRGPVDIEKRWKILESQVEFQDALMTIADTLPTIEVTNVETGEVEQTDVFKYFSYNQKVHKRPSDALEDARRLDRNKEWLGNLAKEALKILEMNKIIESEA